MENLEYQLDPSKKSNLYQASEHFLRWVISAYLKHNGGSVVDAARNLQVSRTTLHEMIKRLGLEHLKKRKPRTTKKGDSNGRKES
jgi:DNA-binding NtrC family response regulator